MIAEISSMVCVKEIVSDQGFACSRTAYMQEEVGK